MESSFIAFLVFGSLLLAQSGFSLRDGFGFLDYVRRSFRRAVGDFAPPATVIIPVKGADDGLERNLRAFLAQDYLRFQLIFVVEDETDPAFPVVKSLIDSHDPDERENARSVLLVAAGMSHSNGQKVHNLIRALKFVDPASEVLVFADADALTRPDWLHSLVAPLGDLRVTVSTGFRWYLPASGFVSRLRAAWDSSVATLLGEHGRNFPWGGSMAVRMDDFKRLQVAERYWAATVSDDYGLKHAVEDARGWVRFEPRCLVASRQDSSFREFVRWTNRQIIITRTYAPKLWRMGLASHLLYCGTLIFGLFLLIEPGTAAVERMTVAGFIVAILALGISKGRIRTKVAREVFPETSESLSCYWQFAPLVPWIMLWNLVTAGLTRQIEWGGVHYRLYPRRVDILGREESQ